MVSTPTQQDKTWAPPGEPNAERIARLERQVADLEQRLAWLWKISRHHFNRLATEDELGSYRDGGR